VNKAFLIGNLTKDPELRTTRDGDSVCSFTIAVNRRRTAQAGQPEADFFRVTAWRQLGENCAKWLIKGNKVSVVGTVSASAYIGNDGQPRANLEVTANEVEFLSPANTVPGEKPVQQAAPKADAQSGFTEVPNDDLPF
jgi:single-strand DNA-binding protein